ncbi:MAG: hypothetical protein HFH83_09885 [Lachnospiraceae bacterium]|jgi:M6 family metalloprotease-like protein|nr:hypothetical protein [Lachnospiraceae bacterium]
MRGRLQNAGSRFFHRVCGEECGRGAAPKCRSLPIRLLTFALAVLLGILPALLPAEKAEAAGSQEMTNLVVFVKSCDDNKDTFNATSNGVSNWQEIKKLYDLGTTTTGQNNSFTSYISAVTNGKYSVKNYFPQERSGGGGVDTYQLSGNVSDYDALVREVLGAFNSGKIVLNQPDVKLDHLSSGVLDNLTIMIQGRIQGISSSIHKEYMYSETVGGVRVRNYNVVQAEDLITDPPSLMFNTRQGLIAHEFLHTLGLPDLYRGSSNSAPGDPVGMWDIMASGTNFMQFPLSYLRARQGWISMGTITQSGTYTLTAVSENSDNSVFAIKTPLSDTEFICVEYRKPGATLDQFNRFPSSGLLIYRVDNKVPRYTNVEGKNYLYVYRKGVKDPESGENSSALNNAALDGTPGRDVYGSTDLSADFTQDTLYYSDGTNSGIRISDVKFSGDRKQVTFTVTMADYGKVSLWEKLGGSVGSQVTGDSSLYADPVTGEVYLACAEGSFSNAAVRVKRWNGSTWQEVGSSVGKGLYPQLALCGGELYLSFVNSAADSTSYYKWNGAAWSPLRTVQGQGIKYTQFIVEGNEIYGAYQSGNRLVIQDVKSGAVVTDTLTANDFANPSVVKQGTLFYVAYGENPNPGQIKVYDTVKKSWSTAYTIPGGTSNWHRITKSGQKLYVYMGHQQRESELAIFDGKSWSSKTIPGTGSVHSEFLDAVGSEVFLTYYDSSEKKAKVIKCTDYAFQLYSDNLGTSLQYLTTASQGNTLYAVTQIEGQGYLTVQKKVLPTGGGTTPPTEPEKPQDPMKITLTPPAGFTDSHIFIDGIEYTAVKNGGSYSLNLPDTKGKTAVMYRYDSKNVPVGMYVWKLSWQGQVCRATPMPGLQDLLSYHGFSIRTQGAAGIRFKSGIDTALKQKLLTTGVEGCRLTEYGTLFITNENRKKYPFIKGGTKVGGGRAYWTENGTVNDKVFETVAGRSRFTSVLTNLGPSMYAKDICFRSYAVLSCDGTEIIVYGPPVFRSVYTVAKQVQAKGEFKPGSNGYKYVQGIIDSVEK